MQLRRIVLYATWASLAWAGLLTGLAAAGNHWVLDRVAGGRYADSEMPSWLRVVYAGFTAFMLVVAWLANRYFHDDVTLRQRNLGRLIMLVFALSALLNAISPSRPERFNAIGAAITVVGVSILRRRRLRDSIDLRFRR